MNHRTVEPSLERKNFTCPSCNQLSEQAWFNTYANRINNPEGTPLRIQGDDLERLSQNAQFPPDVRKQKGEYWNRVNSGEVFFDRWVPVHLDVFVAGVEISLCRSCMQTAIWLGGKIVYPRSDGKD